MTEQEAYDEARLRIRRAREIGAELLDFGDLPLAALPSELGELGRLKVLLLGGYKPEVRDGTWTWTWDDYRPPKAITDLGPLSTLSALTTLDLSRTQVSTLCPLRGLPALRTLDVSFTKVNDLGALASQRALAKLNLQACEGVSDLGPLGGLSDMTWLSISRTSVTDLAPVAGLTSLAYLDASVTEVWDLQPLAHLAALGSLALGRCNRIADLAPLNGCRSLTSLDASSTQVIDLRPLAGLQVVNRLSARSTNVADLSPLAGLTSLTWLDICYTKVSDLKPLSNISALRVLKISGTSVGDLSPLRGCPELVSLDISETQVSDLTPLTGLSALEGISLFDCENLTRIDPLAKLPFLVRLSLGNCKGVTDFTPVIGLLGRLNRLILTGCRFSNLPPELCGDGDENVIEKVRAHFADLAQGAADDAEVKLFVLGNGGVGKTQLRGRLCQPDFTFNPEHDSTHGVQIDHFDLTVNDRPVRVNLWDFGGQDIYHGTHALFLHRRALLVIVWEPGRESGDYAENSIAMRHRPLPYWLDYVRGLAGDNAPIVVVKNKCDDVTSDRSAHPAMPAGHPFCEHVAFSAKTGRGLSTLREKIADAVEYLHRDRPSQQIGVGRARVRDRLRSMLASDQKRPEAERQHRTLSRADFDALCAQSGDVSDPAALLDFLHQTGVVHHREGLFGGRIILDQSWALDGIYAVFHRGRTLRQLRQTGGRFTLDTLAALAWPDKPDADQRALFGMMESCGICFRVRHLTEDGQHLTEYLAPDLLPEWPAVERRLADRLPLTAPDATATAGCRFLHEGLLRAFLSHLGQGAGDNAEYGRYGCCLYDDQTRSRLVVRSRLADDVSSGAGEVTFNAWGPGADLLAERALVQFLRLPFGQQPEAARSWPDGAACRLVSPDADVPLCVAAPEPRGNAREVFVSYAHQVADAEVAAMCDALRGWGEVVLRDKEEMGYGDSIRDFMRRAGTASHVVLVIGEKYLRSEYCMTELFEVYLRTGMHRDEFLRRVIPITLSCGAIFSPEDRAEHGLHWKARHAKLHDYAAAGVLAQDDYAAWQAMTTWAQQVANVLAHVANTLHPASFADASASDYAYLRRRLG